MAKKGNVAELEVAKLIQPWWRQVEPAALFVRTPRSGGWQHGPEFDACGDLMAKGAPGWPFLVEVKRREAGSLENLLAGKACPVWGWWVETQDDAARVGREPMLWFRRNRCPWRVLVRDVYIRIPGLPPDAVWRRGVLRGVGARPAMFLGGRLLAHDPTVFRRV